MIIRLFHECDMNKTLLGCCMCLFIVFVQKHLEVEDHLWGSVFFFHHVGRGN